MKPLSNKEIAYLLYEISVFYTMKDVPFKPMAYERASDAIESLKESVRDIYERGGMKALEEIDGVGKGIAEHLENLLKTGRLPEYDHLKKEFPVEVHELSEVPGIGAQTIKTLWKKLGIKNIAELEKAAKEGLVSKIKGFGVKTEQKILEGIAFMRSSGGRHLLGAVLPEARALEDTIKKFSGVEDALVCGSVRRRRETIGDIDIIAIGTDAEKIMAQFVALPGVAHIYGQGATKTNIRFGNGIDADLRVVPKRSFGAAVNYFTGSKSHNIALREIAQEKGWKLNEYGLFKRQATRPNDLSRSVGRAGDKRQGEGWEFVAGKTEKELYEKLGLSYIEPELREMTGEIEAAREGKLPALVGYHDLKGDLQTQTDWTDGADSIEDMARAAHTAGLEYIVITDHTRSLAMTGGADEAKLHR